MYLNELCERARKGDGGAEKELFEHLAVSFRIFVRQRIGNMEESEEVVSEALLTIAQKYRELEIESSFPAWAYKILRFKLMRYYRDKKMREKTMSEMKFLAPGPVGQADSPLKIKLLDCLRKMSRTRLRHARVISLHFQGYKVAEICDRMSITKSNLYAMLSRAREMLIRCLESGDIA